MAFHFPDDTLCQTTSFRLETIQHFLKIHFPLTSIYSPPKTKHLVNAAEEGEQYPIPTGMRCRSPLPSNEILKNARNYLKRQKKKKKKKKRVDNIILVYSFAARKVFAMWPTVLREQLHYVAKKEHQTLSGRKGCREKLLSYRDQEPRLEIDGKMF